MPTVELLSITPNAADLIKTACSMPYGKDISDNALKSIINSGHLSVLEHATATFKVKCSVRVLGQITRHRHLSFTCKSARGSKFDTFYDPTNQREYKGDCSLSYYADALDIGLAEQDAAYWLPQGVETEFVVTANFRAWFEYLPKRQCKRAMPEHRKVANEIKGLLADACPLVFDRNFLNCNRCNERSCSFK